jgi:CheY-like chemotaxis protein
MNPPRILVVDDNTADVGLLRLALNRQGEEYVLEVLETAEAALRFVEDTRVRPQPCVILLDLHLPKYDGLAILQAIKQSPRLDHVHVMVLSGMASPSERGRIATMGASYRQKPFDLNDYVDLGAEILALCADQSARAA